MNSSNYIIASPRKATGNAAADVAVQLHKTLPFPIEINRMIYSYVFSEVYQVIWPASFQNSPRAQILNILQVSSTVYNETFDILYNDSTFKFDVLVSVRDKDDVFKAKVQSGKRARLDVHCFPNESTDYHDLPARVNRYINALVHSTQAHHLQLNINEFAISRIANWRTFNLSSRFEVVEIQALLKTYGFARLTRRAVANGKATLETLARVAMAELMQPMESRYDTVKVRWGTVEGRPPHSIATDADYWLIVQAEPKMKDLNPLFARALKSFNLRQVPIQ